MHVHCFESVLHGEICASFRFVIELSKCWACDAENFESYILYPRKLNFYMQISFKGRCIVMLCYFQVMSMIVFADFFISAISQMKIDRKWRRLGADRAYKNIYN